MAATLVSCAQGTDSGDTHFGSADRSTFVPTPFDEITTQDCLGDSVPIDGMVPAIACTEPGALAIEAVVTVGADAPVAQPAEAVVLGYATAACEPSVRAYADRRGIPVTGLMQVTVVPEDRWDGPDTPVVCAVAES
ncbi:hypothetical protein KQI48_06135 [Cellulomonas hominis]|uniref:hypothetical protein n=1 Tax=Cellulomonas hominis TaxID=156981 RepID=UPI001C11889B|nr:hypothetical protein [Cellulomonas hominis]MBU5422238.1 hypothetical protein [Cellulomonas hominis]